MYATHVDEFILIITIELSKQREISKVYESFI